MAAGGHGGARADGRRVRPGRARRVRDGRGAPHLGGPTRSAKGEVTDVDGNPIPRLFSAGELGCIYGYMYNGGGNVGEALASGRIAVRNAAALEPWE